MQSGAKRMALTNTITIMIVKDNLPLDHVHGDGFKLMMKTLGISVFHAFKTYE